MIVPHRRQRHFTSSTPSSRRLRVLLAALLGVGVAVLISACGSSGKLIPLADSGPLQSDFEAVSHLAEEGNGSCSETEAAILKTEQDFAALPTSVDSALRNTLRKGISNLRTRALAMCAEPATTTAATTTTKTTTTQTATTPATTTPTATTPATTTPGGTEPGTGETESGTGGGTPVPETGEVTPGTGQKEAEGNGVGENGVGAAGGVGPQEGAK